MRTINLNHKKTRAEVIAAYLGTRRAFAFSCGNATRWLERQGVNITPIDGSILTAKRYITPEEAEKFFDGFNATSGYLPTFLMERLGQRLYFENVIDHIDAGSYIIVPFGSGELIMALAYFIPAHRLIAITSENCKHTSQEMLSPLTHFVKTNFTIIKSDACDIEGLKSRARCQFPDGIFIDTSSVMQ